MRIRDWSSDVCSSDLFSVGGQDDVLFDGDSTAVEGDGRIAFAAPLFDEGVFALTFADGRFHGGSVRAELSTEAAVYRGLVQSVRDYVNRNGFPGALLGLSGGIDSALVAAIAADALGAERVWGGIGRASWRERVGRDG